MSLWIITAAKPNTSEPVDWYFDDIFEVEKAYMLALSQGIRPGIQRVRAMDGGQNMKTIRMKKADWEKWDAGLRSGEYAQGTGKLKTEAGAYCCLGVLQMALDGDVERSPLGHSFGYPTTEWRRKHEVLFARDNEFHDGYGYPDLPALRCDALYANDTKRYSFVRIADAIKDAVEFTDA